MSLADAVSSIASQVSAKGVLRSVSYRLGWRTKIPYRIGVNPFVYEHSPEAVDGVLEIAATHAVLLVDDVATCETSLPDGVAGIPAMSIEEYCGDSIRRCVGFVILNGRASRYLASGDGIGFRSLDYTDSLGEAFCSMRYALELMALFPWWLPRTLSMYIDEGQPAVAKQDEARSDRKVFLKDYVSSEVYVHTRDREPWLSIAGAWNEQQSSVSTGRPDFSVESCSDFSSSVPCACFTFRDNKLVSLR